LARRASSEIGVARAVRRLQTFDLTDSGGVPPDNSDNELKFSARFHFEAKAQYHVPGAIDNSGCGKGFLVAPGAGGRLTGETRISPAGNADVKPIRPENESPEKKPGAAAQRALAEAEERRRRPTPPAPPEINGRGGLEPVRYGDWEVKGLASDF
jgi:hypothetical protein